MHDPPRRFLTRDDHSAFAAPAQFGPFRVLHQIGVGALGPVFRTYEPERDRLVAVKAFRLDLTPEQADALAGRLSRAAEAGLFHPSIVEPITAGVEGTLAYAAEEYVAAESLDVAMRHYAPASIDTVLPFITQLAGAIDFARAAGVGHGGLHPRDIFVTPEEARATGFGVVEALEQIGIRAPVRRPYTAPERIAGGEWGTPADVFSLAAIAYELLTGRRPAGLGSDLGALSTGASNPSMDALGAVLARAMAAEPSARFPTALAFASALESAARGALPEDMSAPARSGVVAVPESEATGPLPVIIPIPDGTQTGPPAPPDALEEQPVGLEAFPSAEPRDRPFEFDDTTVEDERDEDETHYQIAYEDADPDEAPAGDRRDAEEDVRAEEEADRDQFLLDAAGAVAGAGAVDEFRASATRPPAAAAGGREVWPGARADAPRPSARHDEPVHPGMFQASVGPAAERRERRGGLPLLIALVLGLAAGLGAGYLAWGRSVPPPAVGGPAEPAPSEAPGASGASAGRTGEAVAVQPERGGTADADSASPPSASAPPAGEPPAGAPAPDEPAAEAAAGPTQGTLIVRSTPSGAGVTVNGRWRGRTPLTLDDLPLARYQVRVVQPGYAAASETVALSAGQPSRDISVRLRAQPAPRAGRRPSTTKPAGAAPGAFSGSIYVDSRPRGARVSLDGKPVGVTPLRIPDVPIGSHVVRLELPDHRIWSSSTRVQAGQEVRVTGSLERIQ